MLQNKMDKQGGYTLFCRHAAPWRVQIACSLCPTMKQTHAHQ